MKELKLAWRYVRRHWWQYILGILALFIVDEVNTYVPRFTGEITNGLDQHTLDMGGVMGLVWKTVPSGHFRTGPDAGVGTVSLAFFPVRVGAVD